MTKHSLLTTNHVPYSWAYADATARGAATGFVAADVGKLARQTDDNSLWMLTDESPITWLQIGGAAGGIDSGTSFPGSPSNNDLFYRTDRDLIYFYDGTRWLTTTLYEHNLAVAGGVSATTGYYSAVWTADYDVYCVDLVATMFAASGLSGTAYWRFDLFFWDGATQGSAVATVNNQSGTNATFERKKASINALMGTAKDAIGCVLEKVSTPGNFSGGAFLTYRLVG